MNINDIEKTNEKFVSASSELKKKSLDGIKDIFKNNLKEKEYGFINDDIFLCIFNNGSQQFMTLVESVELDNDNIVIYGDDGISYGENDISAELMYMIFKSMYMRIVEGIVE